MRAAELLRARRLPFVFKTTLMRGNLHEQAALERVARERGCRAHRFGTDISARNDGNQEPARHRIGPRQLFAYYVSPVGGEPVLPVEQPSPDLSRQKAVCAAGATGCAVNPYGEVLPCLQLLLPFGSVRQRNLRDMWENPPEPIRGLRRVQTYGDVPACRPCGLIDFCRRCHGLAHLATGDWRSCDTLARRMAEVTRAVVRHKQRAGTRPAEERAHRKSRLEDDKVDPAHREGAR
jgi:radical SAM protein with 4Fe4S-binding SPASM domain